MYNGFVVFNAIKGNEFKAPDPDGEITALRNLYVVSVLLLLLLLRPNSFQVRPGDPKVYQRRTFTVIVLIFSLIHLIFNNNLIHF